MTTTPIVKPGLEGRSTWWPKDPLARCWFGAALLVAAFVSLLMVSHASEAGGDLAVYRHVVRAVLSGESAYDVDVSAGIPMYTFLYPPSALLLLWPLGLMSATLAAATWFVASVVAVVVSVQVALRRLGARGGEARSWAVVTWVLVTWCVWWGLLLGQVGPVLLALCALDLFRTRPSRWSGVLVGVAAAVKLTPALFLVWWWITGRRRAALTGAATWLGLTGLAWILMPSDSARFWLQGTFANLGRNESPVNTNIQSVAAWIYRLTGAGGSASTFVLTVLVSGAGVLLALWLSRSGAPVSAVALVGVTTAAAAPIGWTHQWVWAPVLVVALWQELSGRLVRLTALGLGLVLSLPLFVLVPWVVLPTDPLMLRIVSGAYVIATTVAVVTALSASRRA